MSWVSRCPRSGIRTTHIPPPCFPGSCWPLWDTYRASSKDHIGLSAEESKLKKKYYNQVNFSTSVELTSRLRATRKHLLTTPQSPTSSTSTPFLPVGWLYTKKAVKPVPAITAIWNIGEFFLSSLSLWSLARIWRSAFWSYFVARFLCDQKQFFSFFPFFLPQQLQVSFPLLSGTLQNVPTIFGKLPGLSPAIDCRWPNLDPPTCSHEPCWLMSDLNNTKSRYIAL